MTIGIDWTAVLDDLAHLLGDVDESNRDVRVPCSTVRLADALGVARGTLRGGSTAVSRGTSTARRCCSAGAC